VACPACGKHVRAKRPVPHEKTVECAITLAQRAMLARGFVMCDNVVQAEHLRRAGGTVEMAPGRIDLARDVDGRYKRDVKTGSYVEIAVDRPYAPREQVHAHRIISGVSFGRNKRAKVLKLLLSDAELCEAARTVNALSVDQKRDVRLFLDKMLRDRELREELDPTWLEELYDG